MAAVRRGSRNILRNKARSLLLLLILALSLGLFAALFRADRSISNQIRALSGSLENTVEIRNAGATGMGAGVELIPEEELVAVEALPEIVGVERQLLVRNVYDEYFPTISITVGNEPGEPLRVATHGEPAAVRIVAGRNFRPEDSGRNVAIVGRLYAENRGLGVGSRFREGDAKAQAGAGEIQATPTEVEIIGVFNSNFAFGDNQVFLPLDTAQSIYGLEGKISVVWATVDSVENVRNVESELREFFGDERDVLTGQGKVDFVASSLRRILAVGQIGVVLSLVVGGVVIMSGMALTAYERTKEIGILKALGASNREVVLQFIAEASLLALLGGVLGLGVFLTFGPGFVNRILGIEPTSVVQPGVEMGLAPVTSLLEVTYQPSWALVLSLLLLAGIFAVLGSLFPLWRAVRLNPAEALRYE